MLHRYPPGDFLVPSQRHCRGRLDGAIEAKLPDSSAEAWVFTKTRESKLEGFQGQLRTLDTRHKLLPFADFQSAITRWECAKLYLANWLQSDMPNYQTDMSLVE
jgi:hypothetical protein